MMNRLNMSFRIELMDILVNKSIYFLLITLLALLKSHYSKGLIKKTILISTNAWDYLYTILLNHHS